MYWDARLQTGSSVQVIATKNIEKSGWKSHRKYIDLQYVIEGKEKFGVIDSAKAVVKNPYDEKEEYAAYTAEGGKYVIGEPSTFLLFFPQDVHSPVIKVAGYDTVRKIAIKIRVAD